MALVFLAVIYLAFISLGLPDSLLGVAWPLIQTEFQTPLDAAGLISMIISAGTIISSLLSGKVTSFMSTGKVTLISCIMTAGALLGFSMVPSFIWFIVFALPLGLGAGSVDAALNNYVATHYKSHHMSWLHCFWGVGATLGPMIMSLFIIHRNSWRNGYSAVSIIQFILVFILLISLPLWDRMEKARHKSSPEESITENDGEDPGIMSTTETGIKTNALHIKGVKYALIAFLFYCAIEITMGLWGSSFLTRIKGIDAATAAQWVSLYYAGITVGRFVSGFVTMRMSNRTLIRCGQLTIFVGILFILIPLPDVFSLIGFILTGLGCAPIYPCMIHETPTRFGKEHSQTIVGYQMAFAYTGTTFFGPLFGSIAAKTTLGIFPFMILGYILFMLLSTEKINLIMKSKTR